MLLSSTIILSITGTSVFRKMVITSKQFASILLKYFPKGVPPLMVALSGGVDSMCLAYLLSQHKRLYQPDLNLIAVTIDHGYRKESGFEALKVQDIMKAWGVRHSIHRLDYGDSVDPSKITNFEEVARDKRYEVFRDISQSSSNSDVPINNIFVAHHFNDQVETYLQRLKMNSTLLGLRGLKPINILPQAVETPLEQPLVVVRPLLSFDKLQLVLTCKENNVPWFEDTTNSDHDVTTRNLIRHVINNVVPEKSKQDPSLEVLSKSNLEKTYKKIEEIDDAIIDRVRRLQNMDLLLINRKQATMKFVIPFDEFENNSDLVLSRYLFSNIQPILAVVYYHWKYAKLERGALPRIRKVFNELQHSSQISTKLKFTNLKLVFDIVMDGITRQVVIRLHRSPWHAYEDNSLRGVEMNTWVLFDLRYWLKISKESGTESVDPTYIEIEAYDKLKHKAVVHQHFDFFDWKNRKVYHDPIIFINTPGKETEVILPTLGLSTNPSYKVDFQLKQNLCKII